VSGFSLVAQEHKVLKRNLNLDCAAASTRRNLTKLNEQLLEIVCAN
jgi:hypothetical protein